MPKLKTQSAKENLLRRVRKQRLKSITVLPSLVTILNGLFGFIAIVFASKGAFAKAGYMVLWAMIADMLDGRLARMSKSTSSFGGQLDSLCDIISFGVAPAIITLTIVENKLELSQFSPAVELFLQRFIRIAAAAYLSCAAIRLARFNVENEEDESAHMSFIGLPCPAAAGLIVSFVILHQEILLGLAAGGSGLWQAVETVVVCMLPFMAVAAALAMISRIRYRHLVNQYLRGKKPVAYLIMALLVIALIIWFRQIALAVAFTAFVASGFRRRRPRPKTADRNQE